MKEFLKEIGIKLDGYQNEDLTYVVDIPDSNEYSKVFTMLDKTRLLHEADSNDEKMNFDVIHYEGERYLVDLYSDYDNDEYRLEVYEKVED